MSLINQMLQDLDRRGSGAAGSDVSLAHIKAVAVPEQSNGMRLAWRAALLSALILGTLVAWFFLRQPAPVIAAAKLPAPP